MTLSEAFEAIGRGETPEQYNKRIKWLKRLVNEREALEDALTVLTAPEDAEKAQKKRKRLEKVLEAINNN